MTERRAYRISGRVQGVGFRWWARTTASGLGLSGVVRNESDGTVHLEAEGGSGELDELEARLREGPPGAAVTGVRRVESRTDRLPPGFEIVR